MVKFPKLAAASITISFFLGLKKSNSTAKKGAYGIKKE